MASRSCQASGCSKPASNQCSRCRKAFYCDDVCQRADWAKHKPLCAPIPPAAGSPQMAPTPDPKTTSTAAAAAPQSARPADHNAERLQAVALLADSKTLREGAVWYVISARWWNQWLAYVGLQGEDIFLTQQAELKELPSQGPAPPSTIDNTPLLDKSGLLSISMRENLDYVLLPEKLVKALSAWYSPAQPELKRYVILQGALQEPKVRVFLSRLLIKTRQQLSLTQPAGVTIEVDPHATIADVKDAVAEAFPRLGTNFELWTLYGGRKDEHLKNLRLEMTECGVYDNDTLLVLSSSDTEDDSDPESGAIVSRGGASSSASGVLRGTAGITGLGNLGNTCFMNSGLQCLSNSQPLRDFFLSGAFVADLNRDNPLGMGGRIAEEFGALMYNMWSTSGGSVAPRDFKWTLGKFAPQFSGYQQHDSQELLAFLLDGLHEDLNRIRSKPIVPAVEQNGRPDEVVAAEAWENHKKRNDSIVVDYFHGQFKSTVKCPDCPKISITYDPFMYLSLPLPVKQTLKVNVTLMFKSGRVVLYGCVIPKNSRIKTLKAQLASLSGVAATNLVLSEVYGSRTFKVYTDDLGASEIRDTDVIYAWEVEGDVEDPVVVTVLHATIKPSAYYSNYSYTTLTYSPQVVCLPRSGASLNAILKQVAPHILPRIKPEAKPMVDDAPADSSAPAAADGDASAAAADPEAPLTWASLKQYCKFWVTNGYGESKREPPADADQAITFVESTWEKPTMTFEWIKSSTIDEESFKKFEIDESAREEEGGAPADAITLQQCLALFETAEKLGEEDKWFCPQCKDDKCATKKFDIQRLPAILVVHLKRFQYTKYFRDKIDTFVDFPVEGLDLSSLQRNMRDQQTSAIYDLFAVSNHMGGMGGGHYTAYAKNSLNQRWYLFDDSYASEVDVSRIKSSSAYVLFYQRRDVKPPAALPQLVRHQPVEAATNPATAYGLLIRRPISQILARTIPCLESLF
eukprot:TRINITY_DN470_c0_g1_i6.p1 TRINITY_DN470_c0_g1~~TRINITY_DN470_c0_g1_i6.p1  ORF type:complete len:1007 (-),score=229.61 TRINITY_DN470_c0_g1_i6:88-3000(-)